MIGLAAIGLISGYLGLLISGGFLAVGLLAPAKPAGEVADAAAAAPRNPTANDLLNKANFDSHRLGRHRRRQHGSSQGIGPRVFGNDSDASRGAVYQGRRRHFAFSGDKFLTYCELRDGQCQFAYSARLPQVRRRCQRVVGGSGLDGRRKNGCRPA